MKRKKVKNIEKEICGICLDEIIGEKKLNCGHKYCKNCIDDWDESCKYISEPSRCPLCKKIFSGYIRYTLKYLQDYLKHKSMDHIMVFAPLIITLLFIENFSYIIKKYTFKTITSLICFLYILFILTYGSEYLIEGCHNCLSKTMVNNGTYSNYYEIQGVYPAYNTGECPPCTHNQYLKEIFIDIQNIYYNTLPYIPFTLVLFLAMIYHMYTIIEVEPKAEWYEKLFFVFIFLFLISSWYVKVEHTTCKEYSDNDIILSSLSKHGYFFDIMDLRASKCSEVVWIEFTTVVFLTTNIEKQIIDEIINDTSNYIDKLNSLLGYNLTYLSEHIQLILIRLKINKEKYK